jgi:hypothetical protein
MNHVIPIVDDMNLPIASAKELGHILTIPIFDFVSYQLLSPSYRFCVSKLSFMSIPKNLQEVVSDPKWTVVIQEEMKTLHKNNT